MSPPGRTRGWTLVELMVAMTLGMLIIAGIGQIYLAAKHSYDLLNSMARIQDVGRYVTEQLTEDIRKSGYWGLMDMRRLGVQVPSLPSNTYYPTGTLIPPDPPTTSTCPTGNADWGRAITQGIYGLDNLLQSSTTYVCLNNRNLDGRDVLVVRYADPTPVASFNVNSLYVRTAPYEASVVFGDPDDCLPGTAGCALFNYVTGFPNPKPDPDPHEHDYDYAVVARAYYVGNSTTATECGDPSKPPLPALLREELGSSGLPSAHELVTGVEDLQFQYKEDGEYKNADNVGNWSNVSAVRFWVLVRDDCPDPTYDDDNKYDFANDPLPYPLHDHYRRALYTSTVALRN